MSYSRRAVLAGVGVTLLAGCTGEGVSPAGPGSSAGGSSGSLSATVDGETIQIDVLTDTVESVSVIDPAGRLWTERTVSAGVTRVDVGLDERYTPGVYRIVGASGGETVAETRVEIVPDLRIVEFDVGQNQPERMPEELGVTGDAQGIVSVENVGSGPEYVRKLLFSGDVPNPTTDIESDENPRTGILGENGPVLVPSGSVITLFSWTVPFLFRGSQTVRCSEERQVGQVEVALVPSVLSDVVSQRYDVEYLSDSGGQCGVVVVGAVDG
jgi:hypothetical protein